MEPLKEDYKRTATFSLNSPQKKQEDRLRKRIKNAKIQFDIKKVRTFKDFDTYFGKYRPILTDNATFALYDPDEHRLFYEKIDCTDCLNEELGHNIDSKPFEILDYEWKILKTGFLGYKNDRMFYLNLQVELSKEKAEGYKVEEIDVKVNSHKIIPIRLILGK